MTDRVLDDTLLARFGSSLGEGSIALLGYGKTLMRAPMGIFGAAMGFAAYPTLTRLALEGDLGGLYRTTTTATRRVLVLALLSQVGLTVAASEIGTLVYGTARIPPERMEELAKNVKAKFKIESESYDPAWTVRLRPDFEREEAL